MDRFIRGSFCLGYDVTDLDAFETANIKRLEKLGEFCNMFDIEFQCGTTESNRYIIEYRIITPTAQRCNSLYREFKDLLKEYFDKPEELIQFKGRLMK
jgi:hypothetical protein